MLKKPLILTSLCLITGCSPETQTPVIEEPLFCDVVQERAVFTQNEIDMREAWGYTRNLAWQYAINLTWDRECEREDAK